MTDINKLVPLIFKWEGDWSDNKNDKGGVTNMGITLSTWKSQGYDKNHDGKLDQTEFTLFKQLQEERLILQIKQRMDKMQFSSFDKDGDNGVTQDELKAVRLEARQKMMQKLRERQLQIKPVASAAEATKK